MAPTTSLKKWFLYALILSCLKPVIPQHMDSKPRNGTLGVCRTVISYNLTQLNYLKGCVVVVGNVRLALIEKHQNFTGISFPELREITGYLLLYRVRGLTSLGQLFPGLTRIRGSELFMNYALIVHDMPTLEEIGLYSLLKIDRGSVIIYAQPTTCFLDTIDWNTIAPRVRHVINRDPAEGGISGVDCTSICSCTRNYTTNRCWNNRKCQRFLDGPDGETCHEECLGCRKTNKNMCSVCRHFTHDSQCVLTCPKDTYVLDINKYCLTLTQCLSLNGWLFNNTCVLSCPIDYKMQNNSGIVTCEPCEHCAETCRNLYIKSLDAMQDAQNCIYVNGSLTIHVRAITEAMPELRTYLTRLKEVSDYIVIYDSLTITSLDFLPSLTRIGGRKLKNGAYSLLIYDMTNLQTLFPANVTKNLKIENGTARIYNNPMLCKKEIDSIIHLFPKKPNDVEVPPSMNGYSGSCTEVDRGLEVQQIQTNSAIVTFSRDQSLTVDYSVLYMRLLPGDTSKIVPESCSDTEWFGVKVQTPSQNLVSIALTNLKPASNYILCIETEDDHKLFSSSNLVSSNTAASRYVTRTSIVSFSTKVGRPEPSFLTEVVAISANSIAIHWVNHIDYSEHITHFQLDVELIHVSEEDIYARNHCEDPVPVDDLNEHYEYSPHANVKRPPDEYESACETMCGILSRGITGSMVQEDFDPCTLGLECEGVEELDSPKNSTFTEFKYFSSISVTVNGSIKEYQVGNLAPYRDYKVRLRACTKEYCSRSNRRAIRTKALRDADLVKVLSVDAYNGEVTAEWDAPTVPNGPILAYILQVKPRKTHIKIGVQISQDTCVSNKFLKASVLTIPVDSYLVRVCTSTLAPENSCTEWVKVYGVYKSEFSQLFRKWWWPGFSGMAGTLLICILSYFGQRYFSCFRLATADDATPLVERRQSDESSSTSSGVNIFTRRPDTSARSRRSRFFNPFLNPRAGTSANVGVELKTYSTGGRRAKDSVGVTSFTTEVPRTVAEETDDESDTEINEENMDTIAL